ncbi:hypothetical protein BU23DRAFT_492296 [Bimuria novae-zelandiae CBS 107.79]|uniref:Rhodopsin domain-containing protein n=1 Tax=Bimuria novae-zelandiae CBS 107.79 TaxID=1447943 RepID=A0A6A5UNQ3_9PLEO|nr:hypothetical protein BU23DRAFT_492296 [Bimuria novae-zelandiae CBS 107.79]
MPAPEGQTAHFGDGYTSLQTALVVVNIVTYALATVALALRIYTSAFINKRTDIGDFFLVASWGVGAGSIACTFIAIRFGFGKHLWNVEATEIMGYYNKLVAMAVTYFWTPSLTKLSVLTLIHNVYRAMWGRICTWVIGIAILVYTVIFTVLTTGPCNPLTGSIECLNNVGAAHAALNILSDVIVVILPIPLVHQLHLPLRQKITVAVLMTLGSFCVVASIGRIAFIADIHGNPDITYVEARVGVWSAVELNVGILGASLARLKPFVQRYFPSLSTSVGGVPRYGKSSGYEDAKPRPERDAYLLHSIQRSGVHTPPAPEDKNAISVQSDIYVEHSRAGAGGGVEEWGYAR